jgi:general secretion pathway protein I
MKGMSMQTARKRVRSSELGAVRSFRFQVSGFESRVQGPRSKVQGLRLSVLSPFQSPRSKVRRRTPNPELRTPNSKGFTLLEVLVALAVLAVALVSLLGLQNRNLRLSTQAERLSTGTLLVREMLTRTQLEGPDAARVTSGDFSDSHPGQYPEFRWHRTVQPSLLEGLWELRVWVTWGEREDEQAELTLFTPLS